jgi:protein-tyrosine-phosphatase
MKPKVLFVCVGNACRSQMAEGFARALGAGRLEAHSAGSHPAGFVAETAIEVMRELGIDISAQRSKGVGDLPAQQWDVLVTMGCGDACPSVPARKRLDWAVPDPIGLSLGEVRRIRDLIRDRVQELVKQLEKKQA